MFFRSCARTLGQLALAVLVVSLGACAKVNDTALGLVSTKVPAYAIINGSLISGEVVLIPDRTGRVQLGSNVALRCAGSMRHTATPSGSVSLTCSDASTTELQYTLLTETRGYGYGNNANGPTSLVFGLPAADARAFLTVPAGKRLALSAATGTLELQ
jgi:hypothetical protein